MGDAERIIGEPSADAAPVESPSVEAEEDMQPSSPVKAGRETGSTTTNSVIVATRLAMLEDKGIQPGTPEWARELEKALKPPLTHVGHHSRSPDFPKKFV